MYYCTFICFLILLNVTGSFSSMNIAKGKIATQSSTRQIYGPQKAVDGIITRNGIERDDGCECCSSTAIGPKRRRAWWQVDLGVASRIQSVKIFYRRQSTDSLAGFSLYLNNVSENLGGLCYRHSGRQLPDSIQTLNCPYTARYVYVYNERRNPIRADYPDTYSEFVYLQICEVEVYGCPSRKYGDNCTNNCSVGCNVISYVCEPDTGYCTFGCRKGFTGLRCEALECSTGLYGEICENNCSVKCKQGGCDRNTGHCNNGCIDGFYGGLCDVSITSRGSEEPIGYVFAVIVVTAVVVILIVTIRRRRCNYFKRVATFSLPQTGRNQEDTRNQEQEGVDYERLGLGGNTDMSSAEKYTSLSRNNVTSSETRNDCNVERNITPFYLTLVSDEDCYDGVSNEYSYCQVDTTELPESNPHTGT